jgi:alanine racemase
VDCHEQYKTWIEIDRKAIRENIAAFRSITKKNTDLFSVVKSNAYGHGLTVFSKLADSFGVDGFCVDSVVEGRKLRKIGIRKPILVLGPTLPPLFKEAAAENITVTVSTLESLKDLERGKTAANFHLKIDTGMHRQGFYPEEVPKVVKLLKSGSGPFQKSLRGIYTHFAVAKDVTYPSYTLRQLAGFEKTRAALVKAGFRDLLSHAAASGGAILYPESHFDAVRVGIGLYGYWPSKEAAIQYPLIWHKKLALRPVLSWRSILSEIKNLKPGDFVGYDITEKIAKKTKAAVVPIGYWHGFPRSLSSVGEVIVGGRRTRVLGRVSMDMIVIGLPGEGVFKAGDQVTFIGNDGRESITAEEFGTRCDTTHYEALTRINPLIKRIAV